MAQLTEEELSGIKGLIDEFTKAKVQLGDTVISQSNILKKVNDIQLSFAKSEEELITKYGKDSVINIETGSITTKEEE